LQGSWRGGEKKEREKSDEKMGKEPGLRGTRSAIGALKKEKLFRGKEKEEHQD